MQSGDFPDHRVTVAVTATALAVGVVAYGADFLGLLAWIAGR